MNPIGVFGGTFDPIHYGHLRTAFELLQALRLAEVRFIPSGDPPHRSSTIADANLRLDMVRLAVQGQPGFVVDDCEYHRDGPSYTFDTLSHLRTEHADAPLGLIIGMDAFLGLTGWHRWDEILNLAHIIVAHRPGWRVPDVGELGDIIQENGTQDFEDLHENLHGRIYVHAVTQLEIASTEIRHLIAAGRDPRFLMPDPVRNFIVESKCYL